MAEGFRASEQCVDYGAFGVTIKAASGVGGYISEPWEWDGTSSHCIKSHDIISRKYNISDHSF